MIFIEFTVPGKPVPKQSFKVSIKNGSVQGHTPARVKKYQQEVHYAAIEKLNEIGYHIEIGMSYFLWYTFYMPDNRRVDNDNLAKGTNDALNGVIWKDDTEIGDMFLQKRIDKGNPRVEARIWVYDSKEYTMRINPECYLGVNYKSTTAS
jgi:Holliday junction resolvase RusA-like endonuclease